PDADTIAGGRWQVRDLEVRASEPAHTSGHVADTLTDHGAVGVDGLGKNAQMYRILAVAVVDVPGDLPRALALFGGGPFHREVVLPPDRQGRGRRAERRRGVELCARRAHRGNQADQAAESNQPHRTLVESRTRAVAYRTGGA